MGIIVGPEIYICIRCIVLEHWAIIHALITQIWKLMFWRGSFD